MTSSNELVDVWSFCTCHFRSTGKVSGFSYVWSLSNLSKTEFLLSQVTMTSSNDLIDVFLHCAFFDQLPNFASCSDMSGLCKKTPFFDQKKNFNLLQSATILKNYVFFEKSYYKVRQPDFFIFYYKVWQKFITKCVR